MMVQSVEAMYYLNTQLQVYYGDMKPANLLIMRDKSIKIGDFGISFLFSKDINQYNLIGCTRGMGLPEVENNMSQTFGLDTILQNDLKCLLNTFYLPYDVLKK